MTLLRCAVLVSGFSLLVGCSSIPRPPDLNKELGIGNKLTLKQMVIGSIVVYYAKDGFVWEVEDRLIGEDLYRITVKQGKLKPSGAGEARIYFHRRAEEISGIQRCKRYTTLEYTESLISDYFDTPQRVTEGVIRCERS